MNNSTKKLTNILTEKNPISMNIYSTSPNFAMTQKPPPVTSGTSRWYKTLCLLLIAFCSLNANAQSIANYTFATNATGSLALDMNSNAIDMSTGTTTLIGASSITGGGSGLVNIGFDIVTMGTRNTQFSVSAHGWLGIGNALTSGNIWNGGGTAGLPRVAPFLVTTTAGGFTQAMGTSSTGKVHSKIVGTSPNRTLVIEYLNMQINSTLTGGSADATFQARIYEATGVMEFVYGTMTVGAGSAAIAGNNVGFSNTSTVFSSVNTATHTASTATTTTQTLNSGTLTDISSVANGSRRVYRYTPVPLTAPTWQAPTLVTGASYSLNWIDNSIGELGFEIYRATDGINYTFQTRTAANAVTFAATSLIPSCQVSQGC